MAYASTATLGQTLLKARKARGWSQEYAADQLGMSQQNYSLYETDGIVDVPLARLTTFSKVFGIPLDGLVTLLIEQPPAPEDISNAAR